jgi:hypothetical protein
VDDTPDLETPETETPEAFFARLGITITDGATDTTLVFASQGFLDAIKRQAGYPPNSEQNDETSFGRSSMSHCSPGTRPGYSTMRWTSSRLRASASSLPS